MRENNVGTQATVKEPSEQHGDTVRSVTHDDTAAAEHEVPEDDPLRVDQNENAQPNKKRRYEPKFQAGWKATYKWQDINSKGGMTCDICTKTGKINPFTKSEGSINFRTSTLNHHQETCEHMQAPKDSVHQSYMAKAVEKAVNKSYSEIKHKEEALICALRTVFCMAKCNIPIHDYEYLLQMQIENGVPFEI